MSVRQMKLRADQWLAEHGFCSSRTAARHLIEDGRVSLADGTPVHKASQLLNAECVVNVAPGKDYVGRGGKKLAGALQVHPWALEGRCCLDLGASTGGFTQVLLQHGASKVYAVDVGHGQLHPLLAGDTRVVSLEGTDARKLTVQQIPEKIDFLTGDLSFISLTKVLPAVVPLLQPDFHAVLLIKPQFEAERHEIGSGGIVRDEGVRRRCVEKIVSFCREELGWHCAGTAESPVTGGDGNVEYLGFFVGEDK